MAAINFERRLNEILLGLPFAVSKEMREFACEDYEALLSWAKQLEGDRSEMERLIRDGCDKLLLAIEDEAERRRPPPAPEQFIGNLAARWTNRVQTSQHTRTNPHLSQMAERTPRRDQLYAAPPTAPIPTLAEPPAREDPDARRSMSVVPSSQPAQPTTHGTNAMSLVVSDDATFVTKKTRRTATVRAKAVLGAESDMFKPSFTSVYKYKGLSDPRAIFDTAAWAGNRIFVVFYYNLMFSMLLLHIPTRYTEVVGEALRVLNGVLHDIDNATDSTNMEDISDKIIRFFSCLYGPEKGWTCHGEKRQFIGTFRSSEFYRSLDTSLQKQIKQ